MNERKISRTLRITFSIVVASLLAVGTVWATPGDMRNEPGTYDDMMRGNSVGDRDWSGMMGGSMMGGSMMGQYAVPGAERISIEEATESVERYVERSGLSDVEVTDVMEFDLNFYAQLREADTKIGALEVLIDPYTGDVYPEPGPNMMWNTKNGHMGLWNGDRSESAKIGEDEAVARAQEYLDTFGSNLEADEHTDAFHGYYTIHILEDEDIVGMLSVSRYDGTVWYHWWHGEYRGTSEESHD